VAGVGCAWPKAPEVDVTVIGFSTRLFTRDSIGIGAFGAAAAIGPVTSLPGVLIGVVEFGGRNGTGKFGHA